MPLLVTSAVRRAPHIAWRPVLFCVFASMTACRSTHVANSPARRIVEVAASATQPSTEATAAVGIGGYVLEPWYDDEDAHATGSEVLVSSEWVGGSLVVHVASVRQVGIRTTITLSRHADDTITASLLGVWECDSRDPKQRLSPSTVLLSSVSVSSSEFDAGEWFTMKFFFLSKSPWYQRRVVCGAVRVRLPR